MNLDEILHQSMSKMINRMKYQRGDPLFFLAEKERRRYLVSLEVKPTGAAGTVTASMLESRAPNAFSEDNDVSIAKSSIL